METGGTHAGTTLADRYDVLQLVGAGGMGEVYRAYDRELDELVALKLIRASFADQPRVLERFRNEVKLARRVTHRNVARTFELVHSAGLMFCTMELVDGESLRDRLRHGTPFAVADAIAIVDEICAGLAAAHAAGVIHRDIKPANILIARDGRIVLADFGIAAVSVFELDELSGTPEYMAPEQARGEAPTPAADLYAVGVVLFELLAGRRAFSGETRAVLAAKQELAALELGGIAPELAAVIARTTARDPADRPRSAEALRAMLSPWTGRATGPDRAGANPLASVELHDVVVVAPRAEGDGAALHVADGVYQAVLARVTRLPRLRVRARPDDDASPTATVIELVARGDLAVAIRHAGVAHHLVLPLAVGALELAADTITGVLQSLLASTPADPAQIEARELALRSRLLARRGLSTSTAALEVAARARARQPDDPDIAALYALAFVRDRVRSAADLDEAAELVRDALERAPENAESHVAAGHLEIHVGEAPRAALHFRTAIACSRHEAEAHAGLGRMLLEAGFLPAAMSRIDDALAIAPNLTTIAWDVARAHALEQRWDAHDRLVEGLTGPSNRAVSRLRHGLWRGARDSFDTNRRALLLERYFEPRLMDLILSDQPEVAWPRVREEALAIVMGGKIRVRRRHAFVAQLVAEFAGIAGDLDAVVQLIDFAVEHRLFDRHWIERCPLIEAARQSGRLAPARAAIARRADAIYDALYGDGEGQETVMERPAR